MKQWSSGEKHAINLTPIGFKGNMLRLCVRFLYSTKAGNRLLKVCTAEPSSAASCNSAKYMMTKIVITKRSPTIAKQRYRNLGKSTTTPAVSVITVKIRLKVNQILTRKILDLMSWV